MAETTRARCERVLSSLQNARLPYEEEIWEIGQLAAPNRCRLSINGPRGKRQKRKMHNEHGLGAFRTLSNGMASGLSSSANPWFALGYEDYEAADRPESKAWLDPVQRAMERRFHLSNFYDTVRGNYHELGLFGTTAAMMVDDPVSVIACYPLTFGEYWVSASMAGPVDMLARRCTTTVKQSVERWGNKVSAHVMRSYDKSDYETEVIAYQLIEKASLNVDPDWFNKPWKSTYWENGAPVDSLLEESGYHEKPFWAPRWDVVGNDTYGYGPGHDALPSLRELQKLTLRKTQVIDKLLSPEIVVANANIKLSRAPGAVTTAPGATSSDVFVPYTIPVQAPEAVRGEVEVVERRIDSITYADLFMAITNMSGIQPRNIEEIAARNEEKLTQLGPVIERVNKEMLEVATDRLFGIMLRGGFFPQPPAELQNRELSTTFISLLARMQRAVGLGQIERLAGFVGNLAGVQPDVLDNIDFDEAVREYADRSGAPAKVSRGKDAVSKLREARAAQAQMEKMAAMAPAIQQGADAARLLSETDVGGKPALDTLVGL